MQSHSHVRVILLPLTQFEVMITGIRFIKHLTMSMVRTKWLGSKNSFGRQHAWYILCPINMIAERRRNVDEREIV